jgi:hypothetical protein
MSSFLQSSYFSPPAARKTRTVRGRGKENVSRRNASGFPPKNRKR